MKCKNKSAMRKAILLAGSSMLIALYTVGCQYDDRQQQQPMGEFFPRPGEVRDLNRAMKVQAASGARADATLHPYHFDKGELNSLGRQKLSLMLDDDDAINPMVIYLNAEQEDEFKAAKQDAVLAYLKEQGLEEKQVSFRPAPNMNTGRAAAEGLARMMKTETGGAGGEGEGAASEEMGGSSMMDSK